MTADVRFKKEKNEVLWGIELVHFILRKKKSRHLAGLLLQLVASRTLCQMSPYVGTVLLHSAKAGFGF